MIIRGTEKAIEEFSKRKSKSLSDGVVELLINKIGLDGHYHVEIDVHTFPFQDYATFSFKLTHKDEEYSLHSKSASGKGYYFEPCWN